MPVKCGESYLSAAPNQDGGHPFSRKKPSSAIAMAKYTPNWQVWRPYKAMETRKVAVPRCTVVAGQIDVSTGGEGGDLDEKAKPLNDRGLPKSRKEYR